jgi:hypothetical protein
MGLAFITPFKLIKPLFIGKIIMIIIGLMELVLLLCGKAYIRESKTDHNNPSAPQQSLIWDSKVQPETVDEAALEQIPVTEAEVEN